MAVAVREQTAGGYKRIGAALAFDAPLVVLLGILKVALRAIVAAKNRIE